MDRIEELIESNNRWKKLFTNSEKKNSDLSQDISKYINTISEQKHLILLLRKEIYNLLLEKSRIWKWILKLFKVKPTKIHIISLSGSSKEQVKFEIQKLTEQFITITGEYTGELIIMEKTDGF